MLSLISLSKFGKRRIIRFQISIFVITGFICSDTEVEKLVFINHSWISPHSLMGIGVGVLFILQQNRRGHNNHKVMYG